MRQWFSLANVAEIATDRGCGCEFRHILSEEPVKYADEVFGNEDPGVRAANTAYFGALMKTLALALTSQRLVELYPVWIGDEHLPPKHTLNLSLTAWTAEHGFLHERFLHRITA